MVNNLGENYSKYRKHDILGNMNNVDISPLTEKQINLLQ